jgi:hypothetical protein
MSGQGWNPPPGHQAGSRVLSAQNTADPIALCPGWSFAMAREGAGAPVNCGSSAAEAARMPHPS